MDITLLVQIILGLVVILSILVVLWKLPSGVKSKDDKIPDKKVPHKNALNIDFKYLQSIIFNKDSSTKELGDALELIIKYHGIIPKRLGVRAHPDSKVYMDILFKLCRHKNASKSIVVKFNNELEKLNKEYKVEINNALMRGLNSRGV